MGRPPLRRATMPEPPPQVRPSSGREERLHELLLQILDRIEREGTSIEDVLAGLRELPSDLRRDLRASLDALRETGLLGPLSSGGS